VKTDMSNEVIEAMVWARATHTALGRRIDPADWERQMGKRLADEIDRLVQREGELREASACPPDSDLLSWVRMVADEWQRRQLTED
jgi:hypothetical protein